MARSSGASRVPAPSWAPSTTRKSIFRFGASGTFGTTTGATVLEANQRMPFRLPVKPSRWRMRARNINLNTPITGAINVADVYYGTPAYDTGGAYTSAFTAAPTVAVPAFATPTDGSEYVGGWVTDPALMPDPGRTYMLSMGLSLGASQVLAANRCGAALKISASTGPAAEAGTTAPTGCNLGGFHYLDVGIEYEWQGAQPHILVLGDSLSEAYSGGSGIGAHQRWPTIAAARSGSIICDNGVAGRQISDFNVATSNWIHQRILATGVQFDAAIIALGTNDIGTTFNQTGPQALARIKTLIDTILPAYGVKSFMLATLAPYGLAGANETNRLTYNASVRQGPFGAAGAIDFDEALRDPAAVASLLAAYNSGDNVHWTTTAHQRVPAFVPDRIALGN